MLQHNERVASEWVMQKHNLRLRLRRFGIRRCFLGD
jgi:hypothetical protein